MPEIITKHQEVVIQILSESGAVCGSGVKPQILTACPPEKFCSLPRGEICVYGLAEIPQMTQITAAELKTAISGAGTPFPAEAIILIFLALALGILVGAFLPHKRAKGRQGH